MHATLPAGPARSRRLWVLLAALGCLLDPEFRVARRFESPRSVPVMAAMVNELEPR